MFTILHHQIFADQTFSFLGGFAAGSSQQPGFPPSSQGQPTQAGYGQQAPTSQYGTYSPGPQAGQPGQSQMYPQQGAYPPMANQVCIGLENALFLLK